MILEHFGHSVAVLIRDGADLQRIVAEDPLRGVADNPARHLVEFLSSPPAADLVSSLDPAKFLPDLFALRGREVHIWYPDGVHGARLTHALLERRLGVSATARNWNTVTKLLSMME